MGSEQSSNAPGSQVRRLGRWARGDKYMVGAYPPEWQERAASDGPVVLVEQPAAAVDGHAVRVPAVPVPAIVASEG